MLIENLKRATKRLEKFKHFSRVSFLKMFLQLSALALFPNESF